MRRLVSRWRYELLALAVALLGAALHVGSSVPRAGTHAPGNALEAVVRGVQSLEGRVSDFKFRLRGPVAVHPDVLVVAIDERGAQRYGLWPWPRDVMAKAIDRLLDAGAKTIGLDMVFTDATAASESSRAMLAKLDAAGELPPALDSLRSELRGLAGAMPDDALEAALRKGGRKIVQGVIPYEEADRQGLPPPKLAEYAELVDPFLLRTVPLGPGVVRELKVETVGLWPYAGVQTPLRRFATSGTRLGHIGTVTDVDGSIRRAAVLMRLTDVRGLLGSVSLIAAATALDAELAPTFDASNRLETIALEGKDGRVTRVPMEGQSPFMLINYPGPSTAVPTLSIADVLDEQASLEKVKGKAVLVGVTLTGLTGDQRVTPFSDHEAGVYVHAAVLSNILKGDTLTRPAPLVLIEALLMVVLSLGLAIAMPRVRFALKLVLIAAVAGGWLAGAWVAFLANTQLNVLMPLVTLLGSSFGVVFLGYLSVDREKSQLKHTFSRYLGEDVMALALDNPERLNRGEKREMTVLFSDIRAFTTLSERMSPETLATFINQYLSPMTKIVFEEGGTLDKYIGDAVMAFWNAPLDQPDHALRACRAALKMVQKLEELQAGWRTAGLPELEIGIGINTGPMVVGNLGSDVRVDYTVIGDAVNLGSRLEGTTKEFEVTIIVSELTWAQVKAEVVCRRLGAVRVMGKQQPVGIYELRRLGQPLAGEAEVIGTFERALEAWTARRFDEAAALFTQVLASWPGDHASRRYLEELASFEKSPPPAAWDGVVTLHTK